MNKYRLTLSIDDEIEAETLEKAWKSFRESVTVGYYGPTKDDVEFVEEVEESVTEPGEV